MAREMEVLDVMTANRDRAIWATAQGKDYKIDDSNTPEFITFPTNRPGPNPDGSYPFHTGEEALKYMTVGKNLKVQPLRRRDDVSRDRQPGADGVRHEGPAVGRRLAELSALEAQRRR